MLNGFGDKENQFLWHIFIAVTSVSVLKEITSVKWLDDPFIFYYKIMNFQNWSYQLNQLVLGLILAFFFPASLSKILCQTEDGTDLMSALSESVLCTL